jgi:hypothetical protein
MRLLIVFYGCTVGRLRGVPPFMGWPKKSLISDLRSLNEPGDFIIGLERK